ncbi:MAG: fasciclin domain-containing protein [Sphingobacteriales bacterium]|nr:fasciclin domain-containing protein [Sphingobacteriales bacterium]
MKILRNLNRMFLMMLLGTTIVASNSSCKDDDPAPAPQKNINEIVNTDTSFSLLKQAVTKAGLGTALSTGNLTVFAPDNAAFAASGINSAAIDALPVATVTNLLTYHVLGSKVVSTAVPVSDSVRTLSTKLLFASRNANGVFVNGVKVKRADVAASNGVIHVISKVLTVPSATIAGIATATPDLSLLLVAVERAGLTGAVSGAGKYTVFAPTNAAFAAAGYPDAASINAAPVPAVAAIVKSHVLPTNVFSSDLIAAAVTPTLQPAVSLTVGTTPPSVKITGSANAASNIVTPNNIVATNGVVHVIDRVLL